VGRGIQPDMHMKPGHNSAGLTRIGIRSDFLNLGTGCGLYAPSAYARVFIFTGFIRNKLAWCGFSKVACGLVLTNWPASGGARSNPCGSSG